MWTCWMSRCWRGGMAPAGPCILFPPAAADASGETARSGPSSVRRIGEYGYGVVRVNCAKEDSGHMDGRGETPARRMKRGTEVEERRTWDQVRIDRRLTSSSPPVFLCD
jgi:hypothetical protein